MEITEVRIKLMDEPNDRLQAFCSITIDGSFVIRDLKIIQGSRGPFVAMPSRKLNDRCSSCGNKNELRAGYCSSCGNRLNQDRAIRDQDGRAKLYADIAHPINTECREMIQGKVLTAFTEEFGKARLPGYICCYDDYGESEFAANFHDGDSTKVPTDETPVIVANLRPTVVPVAHQDTLERRIDQPEVATTSPHSDVMPRARVSLDEDDSFGIGIE